LRDFVFGYDEPVNALIPQVKQLEPRSGHFEFRPGTRLSANAPAFDIARSLVSGLGNALQGPLEASGAGAEAGIHLGLDPASGLGPEAYRLEVTPAGIELQAAAEAGLFYGVQTLSQLLPAESTGVVPCLSIHDEPRFPWRGAMLDVSRHFMPKPFILKFIDLLARHKLNTFHWHLTDDQGWRIEIKRYPRLTEVGSVRACTLIGNDRQRPRRYDDTPHGGYYTQEEIREVVRYAAKRHVTIVPEIDMPGHMQAAISAYPELGNTDMRLQPRCHWGISQHILNPQAGTVRFMQGVLEEVLELFPGSFVHVGGDEAVKREWQESRAAQERMLELGLESEEALQSWFIGEMNDFLTSRGRRLIGWDEILDGGLPSGATVTSWRGLDAARRAAELGHDTVSAPTACTYFDYYQSEDVGSEPLAIGGFTPLEKVYAFEPVPEGLSAEQARYVLGGQGQLWTEYMPGPDQVEYMAFPRLCALAEALWTPAELRGSFTDFEDRLRLHLKRLDVLGVNYRPLD
jgi:hexosaminidase